MAYNAFPMWFGSGAAPQYYQQAAPFSPSGFGAAATVASGATFSGALGQSYGSSYPTWFGAGPAPEFYRAAEQYKPFEHGAGVHTGFHSGLQSIGFGQTAGFGQTHTLAPTQYSSAFPTWFGSGSVPEFYKAPGQFDLGFGQFGGQALGGHVLGSHALSHVAGHSGLGQTVVGGNTAYPTWFGAGAAPDFYKAPAQFDHSFGHVHGGLVHGLHAHQQHGHQHAHLAGHQHGGQQGHAFIGGVPQGVDAQHHRLMNELQGFQWVGHGFHSGLRGPGALTSSAVGPRDLPVDPAHQQLMQEVRHFESHDHAGQHPGLKGSGTAIDQAAGPKDLPDDPQHKKLMEEVRKHSQ